MLSISSLGSSSGSSLRTWFRKNRNGQATYSSSAVGLKTRSGSEQLLNFGDEGGLAEEAVVNTVLLLAKPLLGHGCRRGQVRGHGRRQIVRRPFTVRHSTGDLHPVLGRRQSGCAVVAFDQHTLRLSSFFHRVGRETGEQGLQKRTWQQFLSLVVHRRIAEYKLLAARVTSS